MINANNISKQYSGQILFENSSFIIGSGERLGLVGRNGTGKSTLLKIILGQEFSDTGDITCPKNYQIGSLEQHIHFDHPNLLDECTQVLTGDEIHDSYKAESILMGLGFSKSDFTKPPQSFSGGYQVRINLAKALLKNPSLLLLDEPTNYLDIVSMNWLKKFLRNFKGELILITHDRQFMDDVVTHVMGIHRQSIKKFKGDTAHFYNRVYQEEELYEKTRLNLDQKRKELEAFITRFKAKASKASQAKSKEKQLQKMDKLGALKSEQNLSFQFNYQECPGKILLSASDLAFSYNKHAEQDLFRDLSFQIESRDRIGIIGKNGKGKSTLLNVIASELTPRTGKIQTHPSLKIGFFGQTNIQRLAPGNDIIQEITSANPEIPTQKIRQICGTMLFERDLAKKKIQVLSGGERARVMLGKILAVPTNLLLLDEPTNHLDMQSIQSLVDEIDDYPGALMVVTHNEMLLHAFADKLIVFKQDKAEFFNGSYQDFLDQVGWEDDSFEDAPTNNQNSSSGLTYKESKKQRSELIKERSKVLTPLKKNLERTEEKIISNEEALTSLEGQLLDAYEKGEGTIINQLSSKVHKLKQNIEDLYHRLELGHNELTEKEAHFALLIGED